MNTSTPYFMKSSSMPYAPSRTVVAALSQSESHEQ